MIALCHQASCLIESSAPEGSVAWDKLWQNTEARIQAGDDIVLVSERSWTCADLARSDLTRPPSPTAGPPQPARPHQ